MNSSELRSTLALAGIFGLRMLGLFLLLPVFALHARDLPGGQQAFLVGLTLGIFNIVQAFFHIPLGALSDRIGRKPVVLWGLSLFVAGALIAASHDDLLWIAIGRGIMGAGAISAAVSAWVADLTRDQVRTAAMAIVGGSIGISFALSLVIAAPIYRMIGLDGMFLLLAIMGLLAVLVAWLMVPSPPKQIKQKKVPLLEIALRPELVRLNIGVFVLNATQVAMFLVVPRLLVDAGFPLERHWQIYFPVVVASFFLMVPGIIYGEKKQQLRTVLLAAIVILLISQIIFLQANSLTLIIAGLLIYFVGFNLLEALQPSLVSRWAKEEKGSALGVYNTTQSLGLFTGAALGGLLADWRGELAIFAGGAVLILAWLIIAWPMRDISKQTSAQTAQ
ncbi:MAG: MFS transporter [Polynucleobacter sp.]|nr:MFS transporter [Polynucleobacter sp.]